MLHENGRRKPRIRPTQAPAAHRQALLQGIKREDWRAGPDAALKLGRELARARRDRLLGRPAWRSSAPSSGLTRESGRGCARPSCSTAPIASCARAAIRDRSRHGLRLALARDIALPLELTVHIDETAQVREATVIWRRGATIGIRLGKAAPGGRASALRSLRAQGTLLRDPRLSLVRRSSSPQPEPSRRAY